MSQLAEIVEQVVDVNVGIVFIRARLQYII